MVKLLLTIAYFLIFLVTTALCHGADIVRSSSWAVSGEQSQAFLGCSVASAGDVNGDGYDDILVGADGYDNTQTGVGKVYLYYGSANGPGATPAWTAQGTLRYHSFGNSVASAGDVNGDGFADVIIGAWNYDQVLVYYGSPNGLNVTADWVVADFGTSSREWFGWSVSSAGDVNGDGYDDIIIGMPAYTNGQSSEGRALVYYGSHNGLQSSPNWTYEVNQVDAKFGWSVAKAGDVNGDGFDDIIIGSPNQGVFDYVNGNQPAEGHVYVFHGSASGLSTVPNWIMESNIAGCAFGTSVASAGDVNGDGYSDVIVGAPGWSNGQLYNAGRVYVYLGSAIGLASTPIWTAEGTEEYMYLGNAVSSAGDLNRDGYDEVLVAASGTTDGSLSLSGQFGRVFVFQGSPMSLGANFAWAGSVNQVNDQYGYSVTKAGDVDGDGTADFLVGARLCDGNYVDSGQVYLYYGGGPAYATIAASAGAGGTIDPSGNLQIPTGTDTTYIITPLSGYRISNVQVDGVSMGAIASFTFTDINTDHSINAYFEPLAEQIASGFADLGIWVHNGTYWSNITPSTPENMAYAGTTLYAEFGAGGIWMLNGSSWAMLTPSNPENMVVSGSTLYAEFGAGGIWMYNGSAWTMLTPSNPENMVVAGSNLYAEFGAGGIWMYNGTSWTMLTPSNPETMVAGSGSNIYAEFGAGGIWMFNGSSWTMLSPSNPESLVASGSTLYADCGAGGIYMWNGSSWRQIANANSENMVGYGSLLYADFGAGGLYMWNGTSWAMIANANAENMVPYGTTLFADFGAGGLYSWNGTAWTMLTPSDPIGMAVSN